MKLRFEKAIISLAENLISPLYAVGGVVRNNLIDSSMAQDIDLAANISVEQLLPKLEQFGFTVVAQYKRTGTVVFKSAKSRYEYTAFRKEVYEKGGKHSPISVEPTEDIVQDALRRDFKCNAIYYDVAKDKIVDPLNGVKDVQKRILDTVKEPWAVFSSDGLRLMRLARFAGELNFRPTPDVLSAMRDYADNIKDISPERIYQELQRILQSDSKYSFSDVNGHYTGLKILDETRVLDRLFPALTQGRGMAQRADFHKYDVLEHSLRSTLYAPPSVRLGALLHDVGKPFCYNRDGMYRYHYVEGVKIARDILEWLKADNATVKQVEFLIKEHMVDLDCSMRERKVRLFLANNFSGLEQLLAVKQADFRASLESHQIAPTIVKWRKIIDKMKADGAPFTLKELDVSATELMEIGFTGQDIGKIQKKLFELAVTGEVENVNEKLVILAKHIFRQKTL